MLEADAGQQAIDLRQRDVTTRWPGFSQHDVFQTSAEGLLQPAEHGLGLLKRLDEPSQDPTVASERLRIWQTAVYVLVDDSVTEMIERHLGEFVDAREMGQPFAPAVVERQDVELHRTAREFDLESHRRPARDEHGKDGQTAKSHPDERLKRARRSCSAGGFQLSAGHAVQDVVRPSSRLSLHCGPRASRS